MAADIPENQWHDIDEDIFANRKIVAISKLWRLPDAAYTKQERCYWPATIRCGHLPHTDSVATTKIIGAAIIHALGLRISSCPAHYLVSADRPSSSWLPPQSIEGTCHGRVS
jgi:hypothetical protein